MGSPPPAKFQPARCRNQATSPAAKSAREAYCKIQKKPQRNTYRGFFPMSTGLGQALRDPSHRNTTTQEDAYKVAKSPSCRTTAWMSAIWHKADMLNALGKADIDLPLLTNLDL